ncbi:hypothetical protein J2S43_003688 [Catenuloplanes nepalensis]|uniref:Uncharacterized protein n=1 Tax=Catenuloplanes nepalensis TaxID=587533 RepID=A0ABT9MUQ1_9ACTN|nr:hypothetical protein [Catenuloplanes nepalensis]MDP9795176.1 hypothetical protein [Catenuloplanes nepalensis]
MTATVENVPALGDDLEQRRVKIRRQQLLMATEQWAPGYREVAGGWQKYVCEITSATDEERAWLEAHVAAHGLPDVMRSAEEWFELRRAQGGQANAAATAAFLAGDFDRARDMIDVARAYGAVLETEWLRLHEFVSARAAAAA